jgi:hypothetical protein
MKHYLVPTLCVGTDCLRRFASFRSTRSVGKLGSHAERGNQSKVPVEI